MQHLLAQCSSFVLNHGVFIGFFLGGLAGSITHCLMMCGPSVACQAACGNCAVRTVSQATQWHYHTGRFLGYGALGFAASLLSRQIAAYDFWPVLSASLLVAAGAMFIMSSIYSTHAMHVKLAAKGNFTRGLLMSFMPCGLLYAALMVAATLANPWEGMLAMWCFVLGTLPALLLSSASATLLARRWQYGIRRAGRVLMAINGLSLIAMAIGFVR